MRFWERAKLAARVLFEVRSPSDLLDATGRDLLRRQEETGLWSCGGRCTRMHRRAQTAERIAHRALRRGLDEARHRSEVDAVVRTAMDTALDFSGEEAAELSPAMSRQWVACEALRAKRRIFTDGGVS